jgi:hypothetical protein
MNDTPPNLPPPLPPQNPPLLVLTLGFLPSALVLLSIPFLRGNVATGVYVLMCLLTLACCFTSSFLLFRRKTTRAIIGGILLMLLNGFIALGAGCAAVLNNASFH